MALAVEVGRPMLPFEGGNGYETQWCGPWDVLSATDRSRNLGIFSDHKIHNIVWKKWINEEEKIKNIRIDDNERGGR